jgi:hypothetical protein
MKINLNLLIAITFIAISIWLSFVLKKTNQELVHCEAHAKTIEQKLKHGHYQLGILQEALDLNMGKAPIEIRNYATSHKQNTSLSAILYLKAQACSPCNMPVIEGLINLCAESEVFQIASHDTNRHFLQPVLQKNGLSESGRMRWLAGKLYAYDHPVYDAELLLVDPEGLILGTLPLELLKEKELFATWLQRLTP